MKIKAIETRYKGYRFRSRLEARWAVFFDAFPLKWEYEPEGYDLGKVGYYLPDFYLPDLDGGLFVEVKPNAEDLHEYRIKLEALSDATEKSVLLAVGTPAIRSYLIFRPSSACSWRVEETCFQLKYLPPRNHDGKPRLFAHPGCIEDADCFAAVSAAKSARFEHGEAPR